jgi:hypothetical protein
MSSSPFPRLAKLASLAELVDLTHSGGRDFSNRTVRFLMAVHAGGDGSCPFAYCDFCRGSSFGLM